jgi:hypothetical protein
MACRQCGRPVGMEAQDAMRHVRAKLKALLLID